LTRNNLKYPYSKPYINSRDIASVNSVLKKGYLTQGDKLIKFENRLKNTFKSKYSIACNSGTAALHMIYLALNVGNKNAILTTPITFLATANAAKMCNATVHFADVDKHTGLMDLDEAEKKLKKFKNISFISLVHLGGRLPDLESFYSLAQKYNCLIIEDACHAPGSAFKSKSGKHFLTGSCKYSIASSFSFHAIKHVAMGEGGCITTNDKLLFKKIKLLRNHGMIKNTANKWEYKMKNIGWNYRLDEMSCALGISQLSKLKSSIIKRRSLVRCYEDHLKSYDYITCPTIPINANTHAWHLYSIAVDFKKLKKEKLEVMKYLEKRGIGTQVHYKPLILQEYYKKNSKENFKNAVEYYNKTLSLPLYYQLNYDDIEYICKHLIKALN
tara:strand:- start:6400 stop:7557 length:1158 start_codon:yes stop_codon:yes gene_type:complete